MKLKYYLRGVGIGIIFATIVMTVSGLVHKYDITDEYIIKEAKKLGMVMKDEVSGNNSLFGNGGTQGKEDSQSTEEAETEGNQIPESQMQESQIPESEVIPSESESASEPESESQTPAVSEQPVESESSTREYVTIVVEYGDNARQVAEKLKEAGVIDDSEVFRKYIGSNGYAYDLLVGPYEIPVDADFKEICEILIHR